MDANPQGIDQSVSTLTTRALRNQYLNLAARVVHDSWRDGMLFQGREVPPRRLSWEVLIPEDRELNLEIGQAVTDVFVDLGALLALQRQQLRTALQEVQECLNLIYSEEVPTPGGTSNWKLPNVPLAEKAGPLSVIGQVVVTMLRATESTGPSAIDDALGETQQQDENGTTPARSEDAVAATPANSGGQGS
jgi:hypothetical protein